MDFSFKNAEFRVAGAGATPGPGAPGEPKSPPEWLLFRSMSATELANTLRELATHVDLTKYTKAPTKPKKPKTPRQFDPQHPHVSTAKILAERRKR